MMTPLAAPCGQDHFGGDCARFVLEIEHDVFGEPPHAAEEHLRFALDERRPARQIGVEAFDAAIVQRQHIVLDRFDQELALEFLEHRGILCRDVMRLCPVVGRVELPHVVIVGRQRRHDPRCAMPRDCGPTLVVEAAVDEHLEVLRLMALGGCRRH